MIQMIVYYTIHNWTHYMRISYELPTTDIIIIDDDDDSWIIHMLLYI